MLRYQFQKKTWVFLLALCYEVILVLPIPYRDFFSYHERAELYFSLWVGLSSALVMTCEAEAEFSVCYGMPPDKLVLCQWLPYVSYPLLAAVLLSPIARSRFDFGQIGGMAFASEGSRYLMILFSLFVTFLFLSSLMLLLRVLTGSIYASYGCFFVCYFAFHEFRRLLVNGVYPVSFAKYDLWLTGLLFEPRFPVTDTVWLINRYAYLGLSFLLLLFSVLLLKRGKFQIRL